MYQSLYRKYRPKSFDTIYGQKIAKKILINSIINNKLSHAYLFFGPRGTGKTSMAKMFARICNCENNKNGICCETCPSCVESIEKNCVDIIEIDAASNNGVDEIRELKNKISLVPSNLKYKIYIIDEVHMLSIGAFNALLKTLEEPPEHVIFILATTDFYKVPSTIVSRCQTIEFKNIDNNSMFDCLKNICYKENISIDDLAINEIVNNSNGGLRDAIGLLDKLNSYCDINSKISSVDVKSVLGVISDSDIEFLSNCLVDFKINDFLNLIEIYNNDGKNLFKIYNDLLNYFCNFCLDNYSDQYFNILSIFNNNLMMFKKCDNPLLIFKIISIEVLKLSNKCSKNKILDSQIKSNDNIEKAKKISNNDILLKKSDINNNNSIDNLDKIISVRINNSFYNANKSILNDIKNKWKNLNSDLYDENSGSIICDLLDLSVVVAGENNIMLCSDYESFVDKINHNFDSYENILLEKLNIDQKIVCISNAKWEALKNDYLQKIRSGGKFIYMSDDFNNYIDSNENKSIKNNDVLNKAMSLFGDTFN